MLLSILVPALERRPWRRIVDELQRQCSFIDGTEVLVELDNGQMTSGQKRNLLMSRATGKYVCHVDDDDWVEPDYVHKLVEGCRTDVDVVTFWLDMTYRVYEKWQFGLWESDRSRGRMMCNHLCPRKKEIAELVAFDPSLGYADDQIQFLPIYHAGLLKTEYHIDKILYHYLYNRQTTVNQAGTMRQTAKSYVGAAGLRCYREYGGIFVEVGNYPKVDSGVIVRDNKNKEFFLPTENRDPFYVIRIN